MFYMFGLNMHSLRTPLMQRYLYRFVERKRTDIRLFDGLAEKFFNDVSVVAELARIECFEFLGCLAVGFVIYQNKAVVGLTKCVNRALEQNFGVRVCIRCVFRCGNASR